VSEQRTGAAGFPYSTGRMADLLRSKDWSASPLGHPADWPPALRSAVTLLLDSRFPMCVAWGPELALIYNEAYARILGARHPHALGLPARDVWAEVWDEVSPLIAKALAEEVVYFENQPLAVPGQGEEGRAWFTFSYSPLRDDSGKPAGVYCVCTDTTANVLSQRRQTLRIRFEDRMRHVQAPDDVTRIVAEMLGRHLHADRVGIVEMLPDRNTLLFQADWTSGRVPSLEGRQFPAHAFRTELMDELRAGRTVVTDDAMQFGFTGGNDGSGPYANIQTRAGITVPLIRENDFTAALYVHSMVPRRWRDDEQMLVREVAERAWDAIKRSRAQAALVASHARFRAAIDAVEGVLWTADPSGQMVGEQPGWESLTGQTYEQYRGRGWQQAIHPDDAAATMDAWSRAIAERTVYVYEHRLRRRDGEWRHYSVRAIPTLDADGGVREWVGVHTDITGLRRTEDRLRKLNARLELGIQESLRERDRLWRMSRDILAIASLKGHFLSVNPAFTATLGWSEEEATSIPLIELTHPDDRAELMEKIDTLARGLPLIGYEIRDLCRDGSFRWLSWTVVPEGELLYGVARDITVEKKQAEALHHAEEALRQAQKMEAVGQLTGGIAHDFNNLLASIVSNLELMKMRMAMGSVADLGRYIDSALNVSGRAAALTHRLLAFSRRQTLDPRPVDVNRLVGSMTDLIQRTVGPSVHVNAVLAPHVWTTRCDPNQLESALLNLAINGRDAMPTGGRLTISTGNIVLDEAYCAQYPDIAPGEYVSISVTDTGTGMTPEVVARAFDPFFTTKPLGQGTGLGLSMIYGFVKQSGGHIRIYSQPGSGTTVRMKLPRSFEQADGEPAADIPASSATARADASLLIVDDETPLRDLLGELMEGLGYRILKAGDAAQALQLLQSGPRVDLLVTDLGLPGGMNGRQLAEMARAIQPGLKVLFISGYAEDSATRDGLHAAGMQVLTKPFPMESFASRVRNMLDDLR
jgi:PAS domain S-box-containing protein